MVDIPTGEPTGLVAGDTWTWTRTLADYPAGTWTLKYYFHKSGAAAVISVTATASGTDHLVSVAKASTAGYAAGVYRWDAYVESATERFRVDSGSIEIFPNLGTATLVDARQAAERILDAINAVIETRASKDQESYSIQGRTLARTPLGDLIKFRNIFKAEVARIRAKERVAGGGSSGRNILTRF